MLSSLRPKGSSRDYGPPSVFGAHLAGPDYRLAMGLAGVAPHENPRWGVTRWQTDDRQPEPESSDDLPLWLADKPLPYAKGSDTSREAAEAQHLEAAKQRRLVLAAFREHGPMTPDQCAAKLGQSVLAIRPRCTELRQSGFLELTGERRRNRSGLSAKVLKSVK